MCPPNGRRVVINKKRGLYYIKINDIECRVSTRELMKHLATLPYDEDNISLDDVLTNKYYVLHVLVELCLLKSMGYKIGERTFKEVELEDLWRAHLKALDIELKHAVKDGNKEWVLRRLKELEEFLEDTSLSDEIREEILLLLNKWFYMEEKD
ncbi:hypothetical protein J4526_06815 [Desulfurococcaceae archaeon MEX13E-LK6-19]|nr:hypothetical protein J4526_06815 [Desulfurococcaceae archaeon MEX13E-LK6-19]